MTKFNTKASSVSDGLFVEVEKLEINDELYTTAIANAADVIMENQGNLREDDLVNITAARMTPGFVDYAKGLGIDINKKPELIGDAVYRAIDIDTYDSYGFQNGTLFDSYNHNWDYASDAAEALHGGRVKLQHGYTQNIGRGHGKIGKAVALLGIGLLACAGIGYAVQNWGKETENPKVDKITDSDKDGYPDYFDKHPNDSDSDKDGLIDGMDKDGDGYNNWFERNIQHTDPNIPNNRYVLIFDTKNIEKNKDIYNNHGLVSKEYKIDEHKIKYLLGSDATVDNLNNWIEETSYKSTENDMIIALLSSHGGSKIHGMESTIWYNDGAGNVYGPSEKVVDVSKKFDKIKARNIVLIPSYCDSFHGSDEWTEGSSPKIFASLMTVFGPEAIKYGRGESIDANKDGYISVGEAMDFTLDGYKKDLLDMQKEELDPYVMVPDFDAKDKFGTGPSTVDKVKASYDPKKIAHNTFISDFTYKS